MSASRSNSLTFLYSGDDVCMVRVCDKGSGPRRANVTIQDVPAVGMMDTGADITIMGGELFKKVAAIARLRKRDFKEADKVPQAYNHQKFVLDGCAYGPGHYVWGEDNVYTRVHQNGCPRTASYV